MWPRVLGINCNLYKKFRFKIYAIFGSEIRKNAGPGFGSALNDWGIGSETLSKSKTHDPHEVVNPRWTQKIKCRRLGQALEGCKEENVSDLLQICPKISANPTTCVWQSAVIIKLGSLKSRDQQKLFAPGGQRVGVLSTHNINNK